MRLCVSWLSPPYLMWVVEKLLSCFNICGCVGQVVSRRAEQNICGKQKKDVWVSLPEISLLIWNLCCKPQGTSRRAGFRHGDAFCQPLQLPETWSWFGLLLCVTARPVLEFQLPPALPRGSTSSPSFWAPGIILFHPPQDSSMEWVKTRSLGLVFEHEMCCRSAWPDKLSLHNEHAELCFQTQRCILDTCQRK